MTIWLLIYENYSNFFSFGQIYRNNQQKFNAIKPSIRFGFVLDFCIFCAMCTF